MAVPVRSAPRLQWTKTGHAELSFSSESTACHLSLGRSLVAAPGQAHIMHAGALDFGLFRSFPAQIDHGLNARFCETVKAFAMRLRPPINMFIHLMKVGYTRNVGEGCSLDPGDAQR